MSRAHDREAAVAERVTREVAEGRTALWFAYGTLLDETRKQHGIYGPQAYDRARVLLSQVHVNSGGRLRVDLEAMHRDARAFCEQWGRGDLHALVSGIFGTRLRKAEEERRATEARRRLNEEAAQRRAREQAARERAESMRRRPLLRLARRMRPNPLPEQGPCAGRRLLRAMPVPPDREKPSGWPA